jgi:GMP synthase (glutamine-hydrolysing)
MREEKVYCEIVPYNESVENIKAKNPKGLILSGGPSSVYEKDAYKIESGIYELGLPILGICYGMQLIAHHFGGSVAAANRHEYGKASVSYTDDSTIFKNTQNNSVYWMSHADRVESLPQGFVCIASSDNSDNAAIANYDKKIYALQFHPEVTHSVEGAKVLRNFAKEICGCETTWNMGSFAKEQIIKIKEAVGDTKVLCAVSGGVDSSVVAALLHEAIGERLIPVFVDTGLLRRDEREQVENMFRVNLKIPLISIDASDIYLSRLKGITDPEQKRKIIGHTFIEIFEKEAKKHNDIAFLAQGTLYPDVIESVSVKGPSKTIKSHHNVGGLPEHMKFKLIEPLRELFKDEVRALGVELGIPKDMVMRHPFPGPGLAIRIMGEVNKSDLEILRSADVIMQEELKAGGYYDKTWQSFTVLLNVKSVGVMGDNRTYDNTVCIRIVGSTDGMTATFAHLPHELLERMSTRIINEVEGINRVVYDISNKPPATIEWE